MLRKITTLICLLFVCVFVSFAQNDPVLFTVNGNKVHVSEFDYIYNKNNGESANYSQESLEEYLDLYTKFKLKVEKAREMGLDTVKRLQNELAGYRKQLASSYLVDKEVSEKLIDEVMERMKTDVEVSHIFISLPPTGDAEKINLAEEKIRAIHLELQQGKDFAEMAKTRSEDKRSGLSGGRLGYYTAMLPEGFYGFENAMYDLEIGQFSAPIQSKMGFHIVKVSDKRPARREMEVSHILLKKENRMSKTLIDSLHKELKEGQDFGKLASLFSEDPNTNSKAGYLGFFKTNQFEQIFENAAHALTEDGQISDPVLTQFGWHIIKRHSLKETEDENKLRRKIQGKVSKNERFEIARKGLIEKIKKEVNLQENKIAMAKFVGMLDETFYSYKWQIPANLGEDKLLSIGDEYNKSIMDFAEYCKKDTRSRLRYNKAAPLEESVDKLYESYLDERILAFEESNLANKYPEFKALMREYEEGILLFEATKMEVWDKASQDTVGLEAFYAENKMNYKWEDRLEVVDYQFKSDDPKLTKKFMKKLKKKSTEELKSMFNTDGKEVLISSTRVIEKGSPEAEGINWIPGSLSNSKSEGGVHSMTVAKAKLPDAYKTLKEARGYIIADYQDLLEKNWVESLRSKYAVEINKSVFNSLVK